MSEHLQELSTLAGEVVFRCPDCGQEAHTPEALEHRENCPVINDE